MSVYVSDAQENSNQPLTGICSFQYSPNQKFSHSSETGLTAVEYWQMAILSSLSCHSKIPELASTKKSNKHAVHHPKRKCHTYTQCPHISRMLLFEKGLMFGVRTFPTFRLREFLLWEHVGHRSPPPAGSSQEPDPTSISLTACFQGQVCSHYQATSFTRESTTCSTRASTPCLPFIIVGCSLQYLEMGLEEMQPLLAVRCDVWNP